MLWLVVLSRVGLKFDVVVVVRIFDDLEVVLVSRVGG